MEKDDKIQRRQQQTQKYGLMAMVAMSVIVVTIYLVTNSEQVQQKSDVKPQLLNLEQQKVRSLEGPPSGGNSISLIKDLQLQYNQLDEKVRNLKLRVPIMETDPECLQTTSKLQEVARKLILAKYGKPPHRVRVDLEFPPTIPDFAEQGKDGTIVIEMAPIDLIPVSVWTFLEVARTFKRGAFHRNAGHVLQVQVTSTEVKKPLPFQEYSKQFPHQKGTTGYCGRPSGPCWYVSIMDNTGNHGPGSQQQANPYEADANFGTVVEGFDDVVARIHSIPQKGWLDGPNQIKIIKKTIMVSDGNGGFIPWVDPGPASATE